MGVGDRGDHALLGTVVGERVCGACGEAAARGRPVEGRLATVDRERARGRLDVVVVRGDALRPDLEAAASHVLALGVAVGERVGGGGGEPQVVGHAGGRRVAHALATGHGRGARRVAVGDALVACGDDEVALGDGHVARAHRDGRVVGVGQHHVVDRRRAGVGRRHALVGGHRRHVLALVEPRLERVCRARGRGGVGAVDGIHRRAADLDDGAGEVVGRAVHDLDRRRGEELRRVDGGAIAVGRLERDAVGLTVVGARPAGRAHDRVALGHVELAGHARHVVVARERRAGGRREARRDGVVAHGVRAVALERERDVGVEVVLVGGVGARDREELGHLLVPLAPLRDARGAGGRHGGCRGDLDGLAHGGPGSGGGALDRLVERRDGERGGRDHDGARAHGGGALVVVGRGDGCPHVVAARVAGHAMRVEVRGRERHERRLRARPLVGRRVGAPGGLAGRSVGRLVVGAVGPAGRAHGAYGVDGLADGPGARPRRLVDLVVLGLGAREARDAGGVAAGAGLRVVLVAARVHVVVCDGRLDRGAHDVLDVVEREGLGVVPAERGGRLADRQRSGHEAHVVVREASVLGHAVEVDVDGIRARVVADAVGRLEGELTHGLLGRGALRQVVAHEAGVGALARLEVGRLAVGDGLVGRREREGAARDGELGRARGVLVVAREVPHVVVDVAGVGDVGRGGRDLGAGLVGVCREFVLGGVPDLVGPHGGTRHGDARRVRGSVVGSREALRLGRERAVGNDAERRAGEGHLVVGALAPGEVDLVGSHLVDVERRLLEGELDAQVVTCGNLAVD